MTGLEVNPCSGYIMMHKALRAYNHPPEPAISGGHESWVCITQTGCRDAPAAWVEQMLLASRTLLTLSLACCSMLRIQLRMLLNDASSVTSYTSRMPMAPR